MRSVFSILIVSLMFVSCSEYQKVLKSTDPEYKYVKAKQYFEQGEYSRASVLFSELAPVFKGTTNAEECLFLLAESNLLQRNYVLAGHYYDQFSRNFPSSERTEDAFFKRAFCFYKSSPNARLDQAETKKGIDAFELFIDLYPQSSKILEAQNYISELQDKLVYKSYLSAKLYFDLGNYMGNNYQSAVIDAENSLKDYPDTKYREELSFLILKSKFVEAENSIAEKQPERYRETIDEYYSFVNDFPESQFSREANKILSSSQSAIGK